MKFALVALLLSGCSHHSYLVEPRLVAAAAALGPSERAHAAVEARREENGRAVLVRADALALDRAEPAAGATRVRSHFKRGMAIAGGVLLGAGLSLLAGGIYMLAAPNCVHDCETVFTVGGWALTVLGSGGVAVGTALLSLGFVRRPEEVSAHNSEFRPLTSVASQ
jgi:hypothetical protein